MQTLELNGLNFQRNAESEKLAALVLEAQLNGQDEVAQSFEDQLIQQFFVLQ